jgi:purple acid phosphatase-like protein/calcineurin-like phosphoesterase family protein
MSGSSETTNLWFVTESNLPRMGVPTDLMTQLSMAEQHDYLRRLRPSRRSMLRTSALVAGGAAAAGLLPTGVAAAAPVGSATLISSRTVSSGATVVPFGRHLAFGADPRTQMRIAWQVPAIVSKPFVRIGRHPLSLSQKIPAEIRALHSEVPGAIQATDQYYLHVKLDHLLPGTRYYYGVGHQGFDPGDAAHLATLGQFETAPRRKQDQLKYTFTAFGDQGVSYDALANDAVLLGQNPKFHLHAGDIAYADPSGQGKPVSANGANGTDSYDPRVWDNFLHQTELVARQIPWMVATGNHDMEALYSPNGYGGQQARWDFPGNGPSKCPSVYSFIYGNVGYLSLDANDVSNEITANRGYSGGSQTKWLADRLYFLRTQPDIDFVVIYFHHCAYSTTNQHASEGGVRADWVPLFDKYKVDLVINGHNHVYERTDALRNNSVTRAVPIGGSVEPATDGTVYVTAGGAGRSLYSFPVPDSYEGHQQAPIEVPSYYWDSAGNKVTETIQWSRVRYTGYSFLAVDVAPASPGRTTTLTVRAIAENGSEIDRFVIRREAAKVTVGCRGVARANQKLSAS